MLFRPQLLKGVVLQVDALDQRLEQLLGVRAVERDDRPLRGRRRKPDLELRPLGLEIVLHHGEHARRTAGRGGDVEAIGGEPADHAVVADEAVFAQKQAVAATAGRQRSEEHTSELQSLMRISYAVFCLKKKKTKISTY